MHLKFGDKLNFGVGSLVVSRFDLTVYEPENKKEDREYTIDELMKCGTKLIDACLYQHIGQKDNFIFVQKKEDIQILNPSEVGEALFCIFYCLLTNKIVPNSDPSKEKDIPIFIRNAVKNPKEYHIYSKMLASFDINKLERSWIKRIRLHGIPFATSHRLTLGLLHHENFDILKIFKPDDCSDSSIDFERYIQIAGKGPFWDVIFEHSEWYLDADFRLLFSKIYNDDTLQKILECGFFSEKPQKSRNNYYYSSDSSPNFEQIFPKDTTKEIDIDESSSKTVLPLYINDLFEDEGESKSISIASKAHVSFNPF